MSDRTHEHDHTSGDHAHPHPIQPDLEDTPLSYYQSMTEAVTRLLLDKGVITGAELRGTLEDLDGKSPEVGARLVARAWVDDAFKKRFLDSVNEAATELGIDAGAIPIKAVENTDTVHNVVVCTLCSCYPKYVIGIPPGWYKSRDYRSRMVREPRSVLAEFGTTVPEGTDLVVHDSTADFRYLVLPKRPAGTEAMSEQELATLVTRDCMIGTAIPTVT